MSDKNLKKNPTEKPVAKVDEKVPDNVKKEEAPKASGDKNEQGEKGKTAKSKSKKTDSPQISVKSKATKDSGDVNKQGEKGKPVKKQPPKKTDSPKIPVKSKEARDKCLIFIKPIKKEVKEEEILNLSKDILAVKLKSFRKSTKEFPSLYAILVFADEATADKNYKLLQGKKCRDEVLVVDYVGEKSMNMKKKKEKKGKKEIVKPKAEDLDKLRLFVTGFKSRPTEQELRKLFPKSQGIDIPPLRPSTKSFGFAFIAFNDENSAKEAFESMQKSSQPVVNYAQKPKPKPKA